MPAVSTDAEYRSHIAANLRRLLDSRGWTIRELARRTGEEPMTISRAMREITAPGVGALARIAEAFDVTVDRLIDEPPRNSKKSENAA